MNQNGSSQHRATAPWGRAARMARASSVLALLLGCNDTGRGTVYLTPVTSAEGTIVALAVDVTLSSVDQAYVEIDANGNLLRRQGEAVSALCVDIESVSSTTVHLLAASGSFDPGTDRVRAELRDGRCGDRGRYLADAIYPTHAELPSGDGGRGGAAAAGGGPGSGGKGGTAGGGGAPEGGSGGAAGGPGTAGGGGMGGA
jgi:hypothetical protein